MAKKMATKQTQEAKLSPQERERMHDAYSQLGRKGGKKGGQTRSQQLGHEGYVELGRKGGKARAMQLAHGEKTPEKK